MAYKNIPFHFNSFFSGIRYNLLYLCKTLLYFTNNKKLIFLIKKILIYILPILQDNKAARKRLWMHINKLFLSGCSKRLRGKARENQAAERT